MGKVADMRALLGQDIRIHPRLAQQGEIGSEAFGAVLVGALPPLPAFKKDYVRAFAVVDWDHRLPSQGVVLRLHGCYSDRGYSNAQKFYDTRLAEIRKADRFPEFDVPDFLGVPADEIYEVAATPAGVLESVRLTSEWRRSIGGRHGRNAIDIVGKSSEYAAIAQGVGSRSKMLGDLEAVSWAPPCETEHSTWAVDVWYLLNFDGRIGVGKSFLVDLELGEVVAVRDFSVRAG